LWRIDYCNGVQGFNNNALSNLRNISGGGIRCLCKRCKNKKFIVPDVVMMHLLQKEFMEKYMCWYAHKEPYVPHNTMVEMMVGLTFSYSNVHGVIDDNSNSYKNIVVDAMRINQGHVGQFSIMDEERNSKAARFFDLLKDYDEPLWDGCTNHSKLLVVAQVFNIKSDHGLSEVNYDRIVEWTRSILPKMNMLKEEVLCY
jgi:hypothetical protein